jgi:pimeloyl-ACP methyl ester carboxylesterase
MAAFFLGMGLSRAMLPWLALALGLLLLAAATATVLPRAKRWRSRASPGRKKSRAEPRAEAPSEWNAWLPEDQFIEVEGMRIRYARSGHGKPIVLLHGIGASMHAWRFVFQPLAERFTVIAIDLPGFGLSDPAPDRKYGLDAQARRAATILAALGIRRCWLVGSSMGGAIALWMSKLDPKRFAKVAALAPAIDHTLVPPGARRLRGASRAFRQALGPRAMRLILGRVVAREALLDEATVQAYLRPYVERREALDAFWAGLELLADRRLPRELASPRAEVLILYGQKDQMVKRKGIDRYLRLAPTARFREHPFGGHHIMEDEPSWTASSVIEFFSR